MGTSDGKWSNNRTVVYPESICVTLLTTTTLFKLYFVSNMCFEMKMYYRIFSFRKHNWSISLMGFPGRISLSFLIFLLCKSLKAKVRALPTLSCLLYKNSSENEKTFPIPWISHSFKFAKQTLLDRNGRKFSVKQREPCVQRAAHVSSLLQPHSFFIILHFT